MVNTEKLLQQSCNEESGLLAERSHRPLQDSGSLETFHKKIKRLGWIPFTFVVLALLEGLVVVSMTLYHLVESFPVTDANRSDFVYSLIMLFNCGFVIYFALHGTIKERRVEVFAYIAASLVVTIYIIYKYHDHKEHEQTWKASLLMRKVRMILVVIFEPLTAIFALLSVRQFGWVGFNLIGGDPYRQRKYSYYCYYHAFLKFNIQIFISMLVMDLFSLISASEIVLSVISLTSLVISCILVYKAFPQESKRLYWFHFMFSLVQPIFILYRVLDILIDPTGLTTYVEIPVVGSGCLSLVVYVIMTITGLLVYKNFDGFYMEVLNAQM